MSSYDLVRQDKIVFVCGGNETGHARTRFLEVAQSKLNEYDLFTPESALKNQWQTSDGPFELTEFEEFVAEVSFAIVIFPESPGSFCETGYFSAKESIVKKTLLAINYKYQGYDSFISTGPVHLVNKHSDFRPTQFVDYDGDFVDVIDRLRKRRPEHHRKAIRVNSYK